MMTWMYPQELPEAYTLKEKQKVASEIAVWYAQYNCAVPRIVEPYLPAAPVTMDRDVYLVHGPIFSTTDLQSYETFTAGRGQETTSYVERADKEWEIYNQWPEAKLQGKQHAWIKERDQPPQYNYGMEEENAGGWSITNNIASALKRKSTTPVTPQT